ncbi:maleylpyruvate isomerase family mycothiol-dependent enzyme [Mycobacterium sp. pUA109]|uniref:maleylpyruvate isomerase family mycothiol-dependent enzyme n=1 Tax=Mycobacterium sp. pUA109 TaxID=3238982 RepID=UPI00351AD8DF
MLDMMYRAARRRVADLVSTLRDDQRRTPVPATPGWTVHDVLAHLVGGAADLASGRLDGAPGDAWTSRHVAERRHHSVAELLAEWERIGPAVESGLATAQFSGPNLAGDVIGHEADLHEALGLARPDRAHWQPVLEVMMALVGRRLRHGTALVIRDEHGQQWRCGSGDPETLLRADGYELLRGAFSRRSQRQIAAWDWTPAPTAQMTERFGLFGPREDDQPIPVG